MDPSNATSPVYVAKSDIGLGVFAARTVEKGAFLLTFEGPPFAASHPIHQSEQGANLLQVDETMYLMPQPPGVYVNHSCQPNAGLIETTTLIALRAIRAGEEIRFDYSTTMDEDAWTLVCRCGTLACRGVVRDFKYLPADVQEAYLALGVVQPFIVRKTSALS
jgi:hypothetical protein